MMSPTQRTLATLRRQGAIAESVERYVRTATGGFRRDLFHFADVVAVEADRPGVLFIQCCRTDDMATREAKMRGDHCWPAIQRVLQAENRVQLWGFAKRMGTGRTPRWTARIVSIDG